MIGYKACKAGDTRVIVTLEIPEDAITNMNRKDIVNRETATYRTNKANVLKIEDTEGNEYTHAKSFGYNKSLDYIVHETILVEDYDMDLEDVCAPGIHYFLSRRRAELYGSYSLKQFIDNSSFLFQKWHDNGQKLMECTYENGKLQGLYQTWYSDGRKWVECTYVNGERHGLYQWWYKTDQKQCECNYVNDTIHDLYQAWYVNGLKKEESTYVNGQK
jgi:hypothetical protein